MLSKNVVEPPNSSPPVTKTGRRFTPFKTFIKMGRPFIAFYVLTRQSSLGHMRKLASWPNCQGFSKACRSCRLMDLRQKLTGYPHFFVSALLALSYSDETLLSHPTSDLTRKNVLYLFAPLEDMG